MEKKLVEGEDYYLNEAGLMILTKKYLLKRGRCCQSGCHHCPYGYAEKTNPNIPAEFQNHETPNDRSKFPDVYEGEIPEDFL